MWKKYLHSIRQSVEEYYKPILIGLVVLAIIVYMSYLDAGYNDQLSREIVTPLPSQLDGLQADTALSEVSGDTINSQMNGQFVGPGINASNINVGSMSFDRARGGTLQLGGFNNINGLFSLLDADSLERITMDKDGMVINKGAMTIKDANSKSVIDAQGLSSNTNFRSGIAIKSADQAIAGPGIWTDITSLGLNFILPRGARVLFMSSITAYHNDFDGRTLFRFVLDGSQVGQAWLMSGTVNAQTTEDTITGIHISDVAIGNHYIKIQGYNNNNNSLGGVSATFTNSILTYIILGS